MAGETFIIQTKYITQDHIDLFKEHQIDCRKNYYLDKNGKEIYFYIFSSEVIDAVLTIIGAYPESQKEVKANLRTYIQITPRFFSDIDPGKIYFSRWDGKASASFKNEVFKYLSRIIRTDIEISVPHKDIQSPKNDNDFHIWLWSTPSRDYGFTKPPRKMWGIDVSCRDPSFTPSGKGMVIKDSSGHPVAELVNGNNLYIFHDICHCGTNEEILIFRKILEIVCIKICKTRRRYKKMLKTHSRILTQSAKWHYVHACLGRKDSFIYNQKLIIDTCQREVEEAQRKITQAIARSQMAQHRIEQIKGKQSSHDISANQDEYDNLLKVRGVKSVYVYSDRISVFTDIINCLDPRTNILHEIGKFRIDLFFDGYVRWFNLTHRIDGHESGMHAPHVFASTEACLGNVQSAFPELIAQCEFSMAAQLAIDFVESVNTDDSAGKYINRWPQAKIQPSEREIA